MSTLLLGLFRLIWLLKSGHQAPVLENLALRQQLAVYKRKKKRPRLGWLDRRFWIALAWVWKDWKRALFIVHPDTVVRWQRQRFRRYLAQLSNRPGKVGRPPIGPQLRELVQTLARMNPLWRAPRLHGELLKLGIEISERTVSRLLRTVPRPPSQSWKTFLQNHIGELVATDFFTVPTVRLRVLFVFLVLRHQRREVLHFGVTERPTAEWVGQQMVEAFVEREAPRYLIRDRDAGYGREFRRRVESLGMIPECDTKDGVRQALSELCDEIFLEQLAGWFTDTTTWSQDRGFDVFSPWFEFEHHSILVDLCEEPLIET